MTKRRVMLWMLVCVLAVGAVLSAWLFFFKKPASPTTHTFTKTFDPILHAEKLPSQRLSDLVFGAQPVALTGGTRAASGMPNLWFTYATSTPLDELFTEYTSSLPQMGWQIMQSTKSASAASLTVVHTGWPDPKPIAVITIKPTIVGSLVSISVDHMPITTPIP
jgi:hypothetical protein